MAEPQHQNDGPAPTPQVKPAPAPQAETPKAAKKSAGSTAKLKAEKKPSGKPQRTFPIVPIEEAIKIPAAIKNKNAGQPLETPLVAKACGLSIKNTDFFYLTTASRDYGLTTGTRNTPKIELTDLGRELVYAGSPEVEQRKKVEAFFKVEKFKQVYDHYNGCNLPEDPYLRNTLQNQFAMPPEHHAEFVEVFKANSKYLGIEGGLKSIPTPSGNGFAKALDIRVLGQPQGQVRRA
jgi:hypothetical protein